MADYQGKVVWITGASSGIGKALAIQLDSLGAKLVLSSRNLENAEVADARTLNVYQILNANCLVISESALNRLTDMLS